MADSDRINLQNVGLLQVPESVQKSQYNVLKAEYRKSLVSERTMHYNQLAGLHNPWGKSAHIFDSWALLDICQSNAVLKHVTPLLGPDIVLWESAFYSYSALSPTDTWTRHSDFSPIDPMQGIVVRIAIDPEGIELDYLPGSHIAKGLDETEPMIESLHLAAGSIVCHDIRLVHRYSKPTSTLPCGEYVIHYMPATSQFERDPASPIQQSLASRLPLINYSRCPIWLVQGVDQRQNDFVTGFSPPVGQWTNTQL